MAFCPNCGTQLPEGAQACPNCGASLLPFQQPYAYDPSDHTADFTIQDIQDNKLYAMAACLLGLVGVIISLLAAKDSPFVQFHVRQSIRISLCGMLLALCLIIPILGWVATPVGWIILFVIRIILFFQTSKGKAKDAPIVGSINFLK